MDTLEDEWTARVAASLAVGARWLGAFSLAISTAALLTLSFSMNMQPLASALLSLIVLACAAQAYLMFRIELDRQVFDQLTRSGAATSSALEAFDRAAISLGLRKEISADRSLRDRAVGLLALVRRMGYILLVQIALAVAAHWISPCAI